MHHHLNVIPTTCTCDMHGNCIQKENRQKSGNKLRSCMYMWSGVKHQNPDMHNNCIQNKKMRSGKIRKLP